MTARSASGFVLGTQFDEFLLAPVFEERNGPLSVLSALARLDVDPWHTAAKLAQLPRPTAAQELASMFAILPDGPADRDGIAARVVALLPNQAGSQALPFGGTFRTGDQAIAPHSNFALVFILSMLVGLLVQDFILSHQPISGGAMVQVPATGKAVAISTRAASATP